jgi:tetratricopeptide (TPR) repeat protein
LTNGERTNYGFGWVIQSKLKQPKIVNHSGGWVGFGTFLYNEIDANNGFILLTNNSGENYGGIEDGLSNIMANKPYDIPKLKIESLMLKKFYEGDVGKGIEIYQEFKLDTANYPIPERRLNVLGYKLLNAKKNDYALTVFKLNMEAYPESANTHDSYGDALLLKGDSIGALKKFKQSFEMDNTLKNSLNKALKLDAILNLK